MPLHSIFCASRSTPKTAEQVFSASCDSVQLLFKYAHAECVYMCQCVYILPVANELLNWFHRLLTSVTVSLV